MIKNSLSKNTKSDFAFGGENSVARMPYEKKAANPDIFVITNGIATGDNRKNPSITAEGTFLYRLDMISFDYRRIYTQLRSFIECYDIREIVLSSCENFFIIKPTRELVGQEFLLMKILLINGQLIWSVNLEKLPKGCDGLTFLEVPDTDALNFNIAINSRRDILKCQPILDDLMRRHGIQKKVSKLYEKNSK